MFCLNSYSIPEWSQCDLETSTLAQIILYYSYYVLIWPIHSVSKFSRISFFVEHYYTFSFQHKTLVKKEWFITFKHKIRSFTTWMGSTFMAILPPCATNNPSLQFCTEEITVAFLLLFLPPILILRMGDFLINSTFNGELCTPYKYEPKKIFVCFG